MVNFNTEKWRNERRNNLPYGKWICRDGSEVLFNRRYAPMHRRRADGTITTWPKPFINDRYPASSTWVEWERQEWFYSDATKEADKRNAGLKALADWGL